jgi:hypothetical protein
VKVESSVVSHFTASKVPDLEREAKAFGKYLIGEEISEAAIHLYLEAHKTNSFELDEKETRLLKFIYKHPGFTGMIDGGLALQKKDSTIRKKIFFMLAILETFPEYSRHYLFPDPASAENLLEFFLFGVRGVMRMVLGYLVVKIA